jgi:2-C-methyl-D-erythritol 4-phosphate cytidylyltransferase
VTHYQDDYDDPYVNPHLGVRAAGVIPTRGRGSMPFALLDGEPLVSYAAHALSSAGVDLVDFTAAFDEVRAQHHPLVVHDPLCPLTPVEFLRTAICTAVDDDVVVVAVQAVTDTIKSVNDELVGETVDREALWTVTSPVVLPAGVVAELDDWPDSDDFAALVSWLRERYDVRFLQSPALGRRVEDESSVVLLEALAAEKA